jgi:hypothetical protein
MGRRVGANAAGGLRSEGYRRCTDKTAAFPQAFPRFQMRRAGLNEAVAFTVWRSADLEAGLRASVGFRVWALGFSGGMVLKFSGLPCLNWAMGRRDCHENPRRAPRTRRQARAIRYPGNEYRQPKGIADGGWENSEQCDLPVVRAAIVGVGHG